MINTFIDLNEPRYTPISNDPKDYPHGLVRPPEHILAQVTAERYKVLPEFFDDSYAKILLDDRTLRYYYQGFHVAYRSVPEGVEILAVGNDEIGELCRGMTQEQLLSFTCATP